MFLSLSHWFDGVLHSFFDFPFFKTEFVRFSASFYFLQLIVKNLFVRSFTCLVEFVFAWEPNNMFQNWEHISIYQKRLKKRRKLEQAISLSFVRLFPLLILLFINYCLFLLSVSLSFLVKTFRFTAFQISFLVYPWFSLFSEVFRFLQKVLSPRYREFIFRITSYRWHEKLQSNSNYCGEILIYNSSLTKHLTRWSTMFTHSAFIKRSARFKECVFLFLTFEKIKQRQ